ncbi:unnamed protein product [Orchesella dallaii]|uniref:Uncharacterized protein n=1 Tax=Orchesella dallaii TaxID=48710 RepID=A0ABP1PXG1_9HEXA
MFLLSNKYLRLKSTPSKISVYFYNLFQRNTGILVLLTILLSKTKMLPAASGNQPPTYRKTSETCFRVTVFLLSFLSVIISLVRFVAIGCIIVNSPDYTSTETEDSSLATCRFDLPEELPLENLVILYYGLTLCSWISAAILVYQEDAIYTDTRIALLFFSKYLIGCSILGEAIAGIVYSIICLNELLNNYWIFIMLGIFIISDIIFFYQLYKKGNLIKKIVKEVGCPPFII